MEPTYTDISYSDQSAAQSLDLYLAEGPGPHPLFIHIHGGGFRRGDKANVRKPFVAMNLEKGVSVASINYRLSAEAKAPAAMHDAARAVQFLRQHFDRWHLDTTRFAAGGPSAGAGISLWLAFHKDLAQPDADDPVAQQSSRLAAVAVNDAQTMYDPRLIRDHIAPQAVDSVGLCGYFGVRPEQIDEPRFATLFEECSPLNHLDQSAPPVLLWYWTFDVPRDETMSTRDGIHHPEFGRILKRRMDALGLTCELHYREQSPAPNNSDATIAYYDRLSAAFVWKHFDIHGDADTTFECKAKPGAGPLE